MFQNSRIPDAVVEYLEDSGYETHKVIGPKGTAIRFDNNCIHTANVPSEQDRDVVISNIRPVHFDIKPRITREYTGSWTHQDVGPDPEQIKPVLRVSE